MAPSPAPRSPAPRSPDPAGARSGAGLRVRTATVDDRSVVADLARRTFVAAFAADNDPSDLDRYVDDAFSEARIGDELTDPDGTFLLAETAPSDGPTRPRAPVRAVAYAHLRPGATASVGGDRPVELVRLYVEPHLTGSGVGSTLLRTAMDVARGHGHDVIWLGVWEHNVGARRFYERRGFAHVGEHAFVLGADVQTDLIMRRTLEQPRVPATYPGARGSSDGGGAA